MDTPKHFSSLTCELKIKQATSVQSKPKTKLFVRSYLPLGNYSNKTSNICLDTREIPTENDSVWNESFSLEGCGTEGSMDISKLKQESLVLELRMRKTMPVFGAIFNLGSSKILGMAEIPLKEVLESPNMVFDKWVTLVATRGRVFEGVKPAKLKVEIRIRVLKDVEMLEKKRLRNMEKNWDECGCKDGHDHGCSCDDYDVFALAGLGKI
ncbi:hypothetical protein L484_022109 [Morus notabilis]|uniref:C2 domain-containing protein n=1 Tax=Morus notabilis TaxID=981085 RepID=W9QKP4_9ROSA|nr:uncharacterized protein LOC21404932 [Morus notabilis]EXB29438.1 hypothetical protein L484_022109 [Morus notabilis]